MSLLTHPRQEYREKKPLRQPFTICSIVNKATKHTTNRYRHIKPGHWRHRRHAQTFEAIENVEIAEIDHTKRHTEYDEAIEDLEKHIYCRHRSASTAR